MRVAVVGAGIVGSCAAAELASAGADVTVFEQFDVDHDRGSSFGDSRIIRRFYDDSYYTGLMESAYPLWRALEKASGQTLIEESGGLYFGPRDHDRIRSAQAGMRAVGATPVLLDAQQLRARFPAFAFDADEAGFVDEEAGSIRASRCVRAAVAAARAAGAQIRTGVKIAAIDPGASGVSLHAAGGESARFDRAIVCAGPWSAGLLTALALPIRATRQQYVHLIPAREAAAFRIGAMPVWIDAASDWYGFPEHGDVPGVKLASHHFGETIDPDAMNRDIDEIAIEQTRAYARRRLPALADGALAYAKVCLYTVTPDEDFIVDSIPGAPACIFFAGCSGHAFKFGALLGAVLSDLARDRAPRVDISRFRMSRFSMGAGRSQRG